MIISIKNANTAGKKTVSFPHSNIKAAIAECLKRAGFIMNAEKKIRHERPYIDVTISESEMSNIHDVQRISKPSRRLYMGVKQIKPYKNGVGVFVFSTPKGIMTDKEARKEQVGGEILFSIW